MGSLETHWFGQADLHIHTIKSIKDGTATPDQVAKRLQRLGAIYHILAVTNHNTIDGAEEVIDALHQKGVNGQVITGEEVTVQEINQAGKRGELIGFFLQETIPENLTITQVIASVRDQKGMLVIPHMFEFWRHGIGSEIAEEVIKKSYEAGIPVAVEVLNARASRTNNIKADNYVEDWNQRDPIRVVRIAGSDAHYWREIGRVAILMPRFTDRDSFVQSLMDNDTRLVRADDDPMRSVVYRTINRVLLMRNKLLGSQRV